MGITTLIVYSQRAIICVAAFSNQAFTLLQPTVGNIFQVGGECQFGIWFPTLVVATI